MKSDGGDGEIIKESFQKHLQIEVGKGKILVGGAGTEGVTAPAPPPKDFDRTLRDVCAFDWSGGTNVADRKHTALANVC